MNTNMVIGPEGARNQKRLGLRLSAVIYWTGLESRRLFFPELLECINIFKLQAIEVYRIETARRK
jgi:hypothetical protein